MRRPALAAACALWACASAALAHDTWFQRQPAQPGEVAVLLGTGNQFPQQEFPIGVEHLARHGCRRGGAALVALQAAGATPTALALRAQVGGEGAAVTCWAQLEPFEVELGPDKIELYLKEINAPSAVREAWAGLRARGLPWKERYTKHARIELRDDRGGTAVPAAPVGMGLDVLLDSGLQALHAGDTLEFRVLRDGVPLAGFAVELRSDRSRIGLWLKTDAEGRARSRVPFAGHWVLRGTDLRLSPTPPDQWESRFVTLAFEVGPADPRPP